MVVSFCLTIQILLTEAIQEIRVQHNGIELHGQKSWSGYSECEILSDIL